MRSVLGLFFAAMGMAGALVLAGCNGGTSSSPPLAITIALTPSGSATIRTGESLTISAALTHDDQSKGVTWNLNGVGTLSNHTSTSVTYTAPATADANTTVTITAISVAQSMATEHLSITVKPPLAVRTTSLPDGTVGLAYSTTLVATGTGFPYVWSIASGSLPSWANLNSMTGVISGIPDAAGTATFTVQIKFSGTPAESATQALTLTVASAIAGTNTELSGQYAFQLQGFDNATGSQWAMVGSFNADGQGKITSGLEDINGPGGYQAAVPFTGTYTVGADHRGSATFTTSSSASASFALAVGTLNDSNVATRGSLIEFDDMSGTSGKRGSGMIFLQAANNFGLAKMNGPYAFQFAGQTQKTGSRLAMVGAYTSDGAGNVAGGQVDANADGTMATYPFTATISADSNTATFGRVTVTPTTVPLHFVYYIVSAERALAISTDAESTTGLLAGEVRAQSSTPYSAASLKGVAVGYGVGLSPMFYNLDSEACAGLWTFDGAGTAQFSMDWVWSWLPSDGPQNVSLSYSVSPNGRVTMNAGSSVLGDFMFYLVDANKGFLMTTVGSVTTGFFEPQDTGPFSNLSISGPRFLGTRAAAIATSTVVSGVGTSAGDGTLNLTLDKSDKAMLLSANVSVPLTVTINSRGRGTYNPGGGVLYVISPKKIVLMSNANDASPTIMILQQ